jgi:predicted Co/Zn/Cd cation transporter (cation efflux family)
VQLRDRLRVSDDEPTRKACYVVCVYVCVCVLWVCLGVWCAGLKVVIFQGLWTVCDLIMVSPHARPAMRCVCVCVYLCFVGVSWCMVCGLKVVIFQSLWTVCDLVMVSPHARPAMRCLWVRVREFFSHVRSLRV